MVPSFKEAGLQAERWSFKEAGPPPPPPPPPEQATRCMRKWGRARAGPSALGGDVQLEDSGKKGIQSMHMGQARPTACWTDTSGGRVEMLFGLSWPAEGQPVLHEPWGMHEEVLKWAATGHGNGAADCAHSGCCAGQAGTDGDRDLLNPQVCPAPKGETRTAATCKDRTTFLHSQIHVARSLPVLFVCDAAS